MDKKIGGRQIVNIRKGETVKDEGLLELQSRSSVEYPIPPGRDCVVVRLTHRPINPSDHNSILIGRLLPLCPSPIPGCEGFGIIHQIGEDVTRFKVGQRVVPLIMIKYYETGYGSWQDYVTLHESHIIAVPSDISDEIASQSIINPWTAFGLLDDIDAPQGEYILQTAAASVLGRQFIQLAKHKGIKTINLVRRAECVSELKSLGADEVINIACEDITLRVKEITNGRLAYAAMDAVGGTLTKDVASSVRDGGKVFIYGVLSGWEIMLRTCDLMRGVDVRWWILTNYVNTDKKREYTASQVMSLLQQKVMQPLVGKMFSLENFKDALVESKREGHGGKVLLVG